MPALCRDCLHRFDDGPHLLRLRVELHQPAEVRVVQRLDHLHREVKQVHLLVHPPVRALEDGGVGEQVLYGLLIIAFLLIEPRGLAAVWLRLKAYFKTWPFSY